MPIEVDQSRFPVVLVRWRGAVRDSEVEKYLAELTKVALRPEPRVLVFDATDAAIPNANQRRMQGEWLKLHQQNIAAYSAGTAFVFSSAIMRSALTAVLWLANIPSEQLVTGSVDEALRWAQERVMKARGQLPVSRAR